LLRRPVVIVVIVIVIDVVIVINPFGRLSSGQHVNWATADLLSTGDHFQGKLSDMGQPARPTQPSITAGSANEYSNPGNCVNH